MRNKSTAFLLMLFLFGLLFWYIISYTSNITSDDTHKQILTYPCNYLITNSGISLTNKHLFIPAPTQTFQFLGYYDKENDICFYKDEKYVYGNDLVFFSGFDYPSLQIVTGIVFDVKGNVYEESCRGGLGCFKDKNAVYYLEGRCLNTAKNYTPDGSDLREAGCLFIRNTDNTFPPESNYDLVRYKGIEKSEESEKKT